MTKTLLFTVLATTITSAAMAQSRPGPARVPAPPAPSAVAVSPLPPAVPAAPQSPAAPAPQPPQASAPPLPAPFAEAFNGLTFDIDPSLFNIDPSLFDLDRSLADLKQSLDAQKETLKAQRGGRGGGSFPIPQPFVRVPEEGSYDQARSMIERDQYDRALPVLDRVIEARGSRADAAMYWKAYSLSKLTRRTEALAVLADLPKQFPNSAWAKDARALDVEIRQASGQSVSTDIADDEVKVLALRGLMQSDPDTAVPAIEKMLAGTSSVRVKDRALFVLSQSRSARAREVITGVATSGSNPELRLSAVRYLGMRSDPESQKMLADLYASTTDVDMKRAILRSFMSANARDRLLAVARTEKSPELRAVAVQQLGAVRGAAELEELYRSEQDKEVKQRILQSMVAANASDKLAQIARTEKEPELQRMAIRNLGASNRPDAAESLRAIYASDAPVETKKAVIEALGMHQNCTVLVGLAKTEKNQELQTQIVRRLSNMTNRCAEARDYMLELLK